MEASIWEIRDGIPKTSSPSLWSSWWWPPPFWLWSSSAVSWAYENRLANVICSNPFVVKGLAFGCGQCRACRVNRRRVWTMRIMLEAAQYEDNAFLTLTYDDDNLPDKGSLVPRDLTLFLKKLRRKYAPNRFRYFAVGEYGDRTSRPHYHLALFGFPSCANGNTSRARRCCKVCDSVRETWGFGNIFIGSLEQQSAAYVCGYILKKMTSKEDKRLCGRHPEFTRMSKRPGIGCDAMDEVASVLMQHGLDESCTDVPHALRIGKQEWPLGVYLKRQLRRRIGRDEKAPQATLDKIRDSLQVVWSDSWNSEVGFYSEKTFKEKIVASTKQERINQDARLRSKKKVVI